MRSMLAATLMLATAVGAHAQTTAQPVPGVRPKVVQTVPIRPPATQTPSETADAMAQAERLLLQSDLAWVGEYNGAITGDVSERMINAIKEYQKNKDRFQQIEEKLNLWRRLGWFGRGRLRLSKCQRRPESSKGQRQDGESKQPGACGNYKSHNGPITDHPSNGGTADRQ